ncbi:MAG: phosphatase PAP2 family protein [Deltaproteobacteria bacterium]|nr:phosphatase PAP2 family protein [Deltaproteobacteria bacterium]
MNSARYFSSVALGFAYLLTSATTNAQHAELRYDPWIDGSITFGVVAAWAGSQAAMGKIAPKTCRWCESNDVDDTARVSLKWHNTRAADGLSNVGGFALMPLFAFSSALVGSSEPGRQSELPVDILLVAEAAAVSMGANQAVKIAVGRQRPFVHAFPPSEMREASSEDNVSFYSGHTTLAFSLAVASGTIASMRGYRHSTWVWATGVVMATSIGYLRIAADKHYLSDVLVGALTGSAAGAAIPYFFHGPRPAVAVTPVPGGFALSGAF